MTDSQLIDKLLLEWSWRCEKGYPDLNNEEDLKLLENLFGIKLAEDKTYEDLGPEATDLANYLTRELSLSKESIIYLSKKKFLIRAPEGVRRQDLINQIEPFTKDIDLVFDRSITGSSLGGYRQPSTGVQVIFKDASTTKLGAIGKENEAFLRDKINTVATQQRPITISIKSEQNGKTLVYPNIVQATDVSKKEETSGAKADINLIDINNKVYGISVKKDGGFRWGSISRSHKEVLENFLEKASQGQIENLEIVQDEANPKVLNMKNPTNNRNYGKIFLTNVPNLEIEDIAFGKDNADVVQRTFSDSDFQANEDSLQISVSKIYETAKDFDKDDLPVVRLEKNETTAYRDYGYSRRGITIRVVPASQMQVGTRANVLVLDYSKIN